MQWCAYGIDPTIATLIAELRVHKDRQRIGGLAMVMAGLPKPAQFDKQFPKGIDQTRFLLSLGHRNCESSTSGRSLRRHHNGLRGSGQPRDKCTDGLPAVCSLL